MLLLFYILQLLLGSTICTKSQHIINLLFPLSMKSQNRCLKPCWLITALNYIQAILMQVTKIQTIWIFHKFSAFVNKSLLSTFSKVYIFFMVRKHFGVKPLQQEWQENKTKMCIETDGNISLKSGSFTVILSFELFYLWSCFHSLLTENIYPISLPNLRLV